MLTPEAVSRTPALLPAGLPALQVPAGAQVERLADADSADECDGPPPTQPGRGQLRQVQGQWPRQPRLTNVYEWPPGTVHITQAPAEQYCSVAEFYSTARHPLCHAQLSSFLAPDLRLLMGGGSG